MKYLAVSTAVIDEIRLPGMEGRISVLGGAGVYALAGMKIWHDELLLVTGVGADFESGPGGWFARNNLSMAGLAVRDKNTAHTIIQYDDNEERVETPIYGLEHYRRLTASAADIGQHCAADTTGVYLFRDTDQLFWQAVGQLKSQYNFSLMWELDARSAVPEKLLEIKAILTYCDILSLNRQEAETLFATDQTAELIGRLQSLGLPLVYLRLGKAGAYILTPEAEHQIPTVPGLEVVDPTGAGNSSSGAVLVGYCEGQDPVTIGLMGTISAAFCLRQHGPPPVLDEQSRHEAQRIMSRLKGSA